MDLEVMIYENGRGTTVNDWLNDRFDELDQYDLYYHNIG